MRPYEVVCAPYAAWIAPLGTPFPDLLSTPNTTWSPLGTSGSLNYSDNGVTVTHGQTMGTFIPAGGTTVRKAWRTQETFTLAFEIADLSPAQYSQVLDGAVLTTSTATTALAGDQHMEVMRGVQVKQFGLLVKGISPVNEAYAAQYEVGSCYQSANPAPRYSKQGPALLAVQFDAMELVPGQMCTWRAQTTPHT